ncbi:hypothetical protein GCM10010912_15290 [Paenibacillus albidus]|uniref:ABC transporter permease n=1 Tax=Paenibacillus albidus TaxID=2041023 RepID=A0A917C723_9BACL|nr:ABC transporter permease [Paenibacillus albidus]GGF71073.1 hypothetical protein GCM10010912_15290 [Paenibacillus albidus]
MIRRAMLAEGMKLKPSAILLPVISSILFVAFVALEWHLYFSKTPQGVYAAFNVIYMFLPFTMLLNTALFASMFAGVEYEAQQWKQLVTLPVSRQLIYWSKTLWILSLLLGTALLIIAGMSILWSFYTSDPLPFLFLVKQVLYSCLASIAALAFQWWLSVQFSNQAVPAAIGFLGAVTSLFLARDTHSWWIKIWPWTYPALATPFNPQHLLWIGCSLVFGLVLLTAGAFHFHKKQFY